jgi:hypothetical protein
MNSAWKLACTVGRGVWFLRKHNVCRQNSILNDGRRHRYCRTVWLTDWLLHQDLVSYTVVSNLYNSTTTRVTLPYIYEWLDKKDHNVGRNSTWGPYITSMFPCYNFSWSFVGVPLHCLHLCIFIAVLSRIKIVETPLALQVLLQPYSKGWI